MACMQVSSSNEFRFLLVLKNNDLRFSVILLSSLLFFFGSKLLINSGRIIRIVSGNALVVEIEKPKNHCLVEIVVMDPTTTQRCDLLEYAIDLEIDWDGDI